MRCFVHFPPALSCFTCSACCACDKYLSYDASNLLQKQQKEMLDAMGSLKLVFVFFALFPDNWKQKQNKKSQVWIRVFVPCRASAA